jgi:hypothetical protein
MVKPRYTQFYGQKAFSDVNRILGSKIYGLDLDMIAYKYVIKGISHEMPINKPVQLESSNATDNSVDKVSSPVKLEYKRQACAILDAKNGLAHTIEATEAHLACCDMASDWNLPYFLVITYLQDMNQNDLENPMLYVIPINEMAESILPPVGSVSSQRGTWMTILAYSQFHHLLRGLSWNGEAAQ